MAKISDVAIVGGVALIGYMLYKGFGSLSNLFSGLNKNVVQQQGMTVSIPTVESILATNQQETQKLLTYIQQQAPDINLRNQYIQNINDFTLWTQQEQTKINDANAFLNSPTGWLNSLDIFGGIGSISRTNATTQIMDSQAKISYYEQQIAINQDKLNAIGG